MKLKNTIPTILACISAGASAQNMPPGPPPDIIAIRLDKNRDHELSKREIRNSTRSLLKLDEDDDGALSKEELRPEPPNGRRRKGDANGNPPPPRPPSVLMAAIDTDGSGDLSEAELEAAPKKLLGLDKDDDGKIDFEEAPSLGDPDDVPPVPPGGGGGRPPHPPGGRR